MKKDIQLLLQHYSKEQLAGRLGVSTRTIERWGKGGDVKQRNDKVHVARLAQNLRIKLQLNQHS